MTTLAQLTRANRPALTRLLAASTTATFAGPWDNRPSWDNAKGGWDNRPTWDNWSKR
jgi:hypothetical protein